MKEKLEEIGKEGGLNMAAGEIHSVIHFSLENLNTSLLAKATLESLDLDGDFDPAEFDKQMAAIYENDALYEDEVRRPVAERDK